MYACILYMKLKTHRQRIHKLTYGNNPTPSIVRKVAEERYLCVFKGDAESAFMSCKKKNTSV